MDTNVRSCRCYFSFRVLSQWLHVQCTATTLGFVIYSVLKALEGPGVQDREANTEIFSSNKIRRDEILIPVRSDLSGTVNPAQPQALINVFCSNAE